MKAVEELGTVFTNEDVQKVIEKIGWEKYIKEIKLGFKHSAAGKADIPHKIYVNTPFGSDMRCMPAYLTEYKGGKYCGVKIVSVAPKNRTKQLPTVIGEYVLRDAETQQMLAIMRAEELTAYRTGAATAVATDALARKNSKVLSIIGAGKQSYYQAKGILAVRKIEKIKIFDLFKPAMERFKESEKDFGVEITMTSSIEEAIKDADIITTVTPSTKPFISTELISDGMHINGVGADAKHKIEFDPNVLAKAKVFVDDIEQCINSGEIYRALQSNIIKKADLVPIGDVLIGKITGRSSETEITFFKSTGVAHEDLITAILVYEELR